MANYTRVKWIQSNQTYWDTGIQHSTNPKIFVDFSIVSLTTNTNDNAIAGVWATSYNSSPSFLIDAHSNAQKFRVYAGGGYVNDCGAYSLNDEWQATLTKTSYEFKNIDTSTVYSGSVAGSNLQSTTYPFRIGARAEGNNVITGGTFKFYEVIFYENDVEVGHYLPYRDDETGYGVLYDTVSGNYLSANVPSGVTAGTPLYPESASTFTSDGGSATYSLETQATWSAVSDSNWIIVSPSSGTGNGTISITVKKNSSYDSGRTGTVTVTDTNDNTLFVWTVEQEKKKYLIKLMNLWKNGAPINKLMIDEYSRYQSFVDFGAITGNTIEYSTTGGTMIEVPRTGWRSPLVSNVYDDYGKLTFLGQPAQIAPNAFSGSDILSFEVPDSVTGIGTSAFAECNEILSLTLNENITSIGAGAFSGCSNLSWIEANADTAPTISADTFQGVSSGGTLKHNPGTDYSTWMSNDPYYLGYYGWEEQTVIDYSTKYFTIESLQDNNTVVFRILTQANWISLASSLDNGATWTNHTSTGNKTLGTLNSGDTVLIKGVANCWGASTSNVGSTPIISATGEYNVYGNIMSLLYGDDFADKYTVPNYQFNFGSLFRNSPKVKDCSNLICPATTVADRTYGCMFCGSTVTALPQFANATAYTSSSLTGGTYQYLARGCTGLTSVSLSLSLPVLGSVLGQHMFYGCTNLTAVTGTISGKLSSNAFEYMFYGCNKIQTVPIFNVSSAASQCCQYMFNGCSQLSAITYLSEVTSTGYYSNWVNGVASSGTFTKNPNATWSTGNSGIPSGWEIVDYSG